MVIDPPFVQIELEKYRDKCQVNRDHTISRTGVYVKFFINTNTKSNKAAIITITTAKTLR
jgi:hypothetical protein